MQALLVIHIAAGALSVLGGVGALSFRKGAPAHRAAGAVFVTAMLVMAATAAALGRDLGNALAGGMAAYMVATGWVAARRRDGEHGRFEFAAFTIAIAVALGIGVDATLLLTGLKAPANPLIGPLSLFISGAIALAAYGDLRVVRRGGLFGSDRIARHLWRMCFGLFIAVGAFAAQGARVLPDWIPRLPLLLGSMTLVLAMMSFWLVRVRLKRGPDRPLKAV